MKSTKYGTGCAYCHKEGHWQWECPDITCFDCNQKGHANSRSEKCKGKNKEGNYYYNNYDNNNYYQEESYYDNYQEEPQEEQSTYQNVKADGPLFKKSQQRYQNQRKTCQECKRTETGMNSITFKEYIVISNEMCGDPKEDQIRKKGNICQKCEQKFEKLILEAKGEWKQVTCNQCGGKGSKNHMYPKEENGRTNFYCDLNCQYARMIRKEGNIDEKRLETLLGKYTMSTKYAGSSYNCVTREEIFNRLNNTEELKQKVRDNNKIQEEYHNQWKENLPEEEKFRSESNMKEAKLAEYESLLQYYGNIDEYISKIRQNESKRENRIQELEQEIAQEKDKQQNILQEEKANWQKWAGNFQEEYNKKIQEQEATISEIQQTYKGLIKSNEILITENEKLAEENRKIKIFEIGQENEELRQVKLESQKLQQENEELRGAKLESQKLQQDNEELRQANLESQKENEELRQANLESQKENEELRQENDLLLKQEEERQKTKKRSLKRKIKDLIK